MSINEVETGDGRRFWVGPDAISVSVEIVRPDIGASIDTVGIRPAGVIKKVPFECGPLKGHAVVVQSPNMEWHEQIKMDMELKVYLDPECQPSIADLLETFVSGVKVVSRNG